MTALAALATVVELPAERLVVPPRLDLFCPGQHCAPVCDPETCHCKPCRCGGCRARARKAQRGRLTGRQVQPVEAHPRLFPSPSSRSQV